MTVELAAVRLLAPHFGSSTTVWTNVIGVVLVSLAVGYVLGARLSTSADPRRHLVRILLGAAVWLIVLPFVAPAVGAALRPDEVALHSALPLFTWGSLAGSLILFAAPIAVLGAAGPLAVELVQRTGVEHAGTAGGWCLGVSTTGSLVGTFATTHLLVPGLGLRATFFVAAGLLVVAAALLAATRRTPASIATAAVLIGLTIVGSLPPSPPEVGDGLTLVAWTESPYTQVRVVERAAEPNDPTGALRFLQVGEVSDSYQSAWQSKPGLLPDGYYYNDFVLPFWWDRTLGAGHPRVLFVGLGAGTGWRVLTGAAPADVRPTGVGIEIDPEVVRLGREHLDLDHPDLEVYAGADARSALRTLEGSFDVIVVDAYAHQFEIPEHLATVEFFGELVERCRPGGWIVSNAAGFGLDDPVVEALAGTLAVALGSEVLALRVPFSRNITLFARVGSPVVTPESEDFVPMQADLARSAQMRCLPGSWRLFGPIDDPLTDDDGFMARLQIESLRRAGASVRAALP
ncbi:spermidine synthase [Planctomycetes bacterium Pla163]|uniref:Spermidine synthase n=2 Tax=Rohdeia mirabilis TaxID=2528008 RepID=A0A518D0H1_9BACT|nr:spermidine synthase [Planctomycetes bacterium Pla163]